jgi:subtilase family serine protease
VFSIDEARAIPEMDELNNVGVHTVEAVAAAAAETASGVPGAVPSPEPNRSVAQARQSGAQPDLSVYAIKVNGQAPDGKNDCNVGKNDVIVVVKNGGTGEAGSFTTRLIVDGDETDATVDNVRAGEEREVRFENVQLKKGERTLKAIADAERTIDETREENNDFKVSARCTDGG